MAADTNTTVANSTYAGAYGTSFQANIHFTGDAWRFIYYPGNGTTTPKAKAAYGDPDSGVFSAVHDVPETNHTSNRGYKIASAYNPILYRHMFVWANDYGKSFVKDDANFTASIATTGITGLTGINGGFGTHDLLWACCIYDHDGRIWLCDTATTQTKIRVKRSDAALDNANWGGYVDIVTGLSGSVAATIVPFHNRAIGCVYADGSSI